MSITPRQFLNYNAFNIIAGIIVIFLFLVFIFGCKQEWDPLEDIDCNPCVITEIDLSDAPRPIITIIDSAGKVKRIISIDFANSYSINDTIWKEEINNN